MVLTEELEEDTKNWIVTMQKLGIPVTRDMVLIKGNQIYMGDFGMKKGIRQLLGNIWLHRFMKRYPLLTMGYSYIMKRVKFKASIDWILEFFQEGTNHIVFVIHTKSITNTAKTGFWSEE